MATINRSYLRLRPEIEEPEIINKKCPCDKKASKVLGIAVLTAVIIGSVIYIAEKKSDEFL